MTSVILPPLIAIKFSGIFLQYSDESSSVTLLRWSGNNVFSRLAKFEVIAANTGNDGEFHIRCFHNKKFLRMSSNGYVSPESDEPNEDKSSSSCTMIVARRLTGGGDKCTLVLNFSGSTEFLIQQTSGALGGVGPPGWATSVGSVFMYEIINLESLVLLPRHLAFKGSNGNFLNVVTVNNQPILQFQSTDEDLGWENSWFEVSTNTHGWARIKSRSNQRWWRLDTVTNSIVADQASDQRATGFLLK